MPDAKKLIQIIKKQEKLIDEVPEEFIGKLEDIQNSIYRELQGFVKNLETDPKGTIKNIDSNKVLASKLRNQIRDWLRDNNYYEEVTEFGKQYDSLINASKEYFNVLDLDPAFTDRDLKTLSKIRADDINFLTVLDQNVINTTYDEVMTSIYSKGDFRDLADRLKKIHTDTEIMSRVYGRYVKIAAKNGLLKTYANTYAYTAYASFDRQIQNIKSAQHNLDHFLYAGSLVMDSREFCVARVGKIFTRKEVESWQNMKWKGKATGRDVWHFLGGWNCSHLLAPITEEYVDMESELENLYSGGGPPKIIKGFKDYSITTRNRETLDKLQNDYRKIGKDWDKTINKEQDNQLKYYKEEGFEEINDILRDRMEKFSYSESDLADSIKLMDNDFKYKLKENTILYRGIKDEKLWEMIKSNKANGIMIKDYGFLSTSIDKNTVLKYFIKNEKNNIIFHIKAKEGIDIAPLDIIDYMDEYELLLRRGQNITIEKCWMDQNVAHAEVSLI